MLQYYDAEEPEVQPDKIIVVNKIAVFSTNLNYVATTEETKWKSQWYVAAGKNRRDEKLRFGAARKVKDELEIEILPRWLKCEQVKFNRNWVEIWWSIALSQDLYRQVAHDTEKRKWKRREFLETAWKAMGNSYGIISVPVQELIKTTRYVEAIEIPVKLATHYPRQKEMPPFGYPDAKFNTFPKGQIFVQVGMRRMNSLFQQWEYCLEVPILHFGNDRSNVSSLQQALQSAFNLHDELWGYRIEKVVGLRYILNEECSPELDSHSPFTMKHNRLVIGLEVIISNMLGGEPSPVHEWKLLPIEHQEEIWRPRVELCFE